MYNLCISIYHYKNHTNILNQLRFNNTEDLHCAITTGTSHTSAMLVSKRLSINTVITGTTSRSLSSSDTLLEYVLGEAIVIKVNPKYIPKITYRMY